MKGKFILIEVDPLLVGYRFAVDAQIHADDRVVPQPLDGVGDVPGKVSYEFGQNGKGKGIDEGVIPHLGSIVEANVMAQRNVPMV